VVHWKENDSEESLLREKKERTKNESATVLRCSFVLEKKRKTIVARLFGHREREKIREKKLRELKKGRKRKEEKKREE